MSLIRPSGGSIQDCVKRRSSKRQDLLPHYGTLILEEDHIMSEIVKAEINDLIIENLQELTDKEKKEILNFIEYLRIKEDHSFIEYVNKRTEEAMEAKRKGERFISLEELQRNYA